MNGVTETERRRQERGLAVSLFESIREEDAVNARLPSKMKDEADLEIGCRETSKEHPLPSRFGRPFTTVARTVFCERCPKEDARTENSLRSVPCGYYPQFSALS